MISNLPELTMCGMRTGKTTAICKAAKEIGATVVVHSLDEKKRIEKEYGVKATTLQAEIRGTRGPYLIDTHAASMAAHRYEDEISKLQLRISELEKENERLKADFQASQLELHRYRTKWLAEEKQTSVLRETLESHSQILRSIIRQWDAPTMDARDRLSALIEEARGMVEQANTSS